MIPMEIGGRFRRKERGIPGAAWPACFLKRVVTSRSRSIMSHAEVLAATGPTSALISRSRWGPEQMVGSPRPRPPRYAPEPIPDPVGSGMEFFAPYRIDNVQIDGYDVVVNQPGGGLPGARAATNAAFCRRSRHRRVWLKN